MAFKIGDKVHWHANRDWEGVIFAIDTVYYTVDWTNKYDGRKSKTGCTQGQLILISAAPTPVGVTAPIPAVEAPKAVSKPTRTCKCGVWKTGGNHSDWCPDYKKDDGPFGFQRLGT